MTRALSIAITILAALLASCQMIHQPATIEGRWVSTTQTGSSDHTLLLPEGELEIDQYVHVDPTLPAVLTQRHRGYWVESSGHLSFEVTQTIDFVDSEMTPLAQPVITDHSTSQVISGAYQVDPYTLTINYDQGAVITYQRR
jgi:hypothetical protein